MITRDQERAKHALEAARGFGPEDGEFTKRLPVLIQTCGLAQALAFAQAKGKAQKLQAALDDWIGKAIPVRAGQAAQPGGSAVLKRIIGQEPDFLLRATDEALAYLFWVARLAEANAKTDKSGSLR